MTPLILWLILYVIRGYKRKCQWLTFMVFYRDIAAVNGLVQDIFKERDRKLEETRKLRKKRRIRVPLSNPIFA